MMKSLFGGFDHVLPDQRRPLEAKSRRGQRSQIAQTGQMDQRTQQEGFFFNHD